jgi:hypothetical protein
VRKMAFKLVVNDGGGGSAKRNTAKPKTTTTRTTIQPVRKTQPAQQSKQTITQMV